MPSRLQACVGTLRFGVVATAKSLIPHLMGESCGLYPFRYSTNLSGLIVCYSLGFDATGGGSQRALEQEFDGHLNADDLDAWLREMSRSPHHVGSPRGREVVEFIAEHFRDWGYDTEIVEYEVLFPSPRTRELELVSPGHYTAGLMEDSLPEDPSTSNIEDLLPPYNAFSIAWRG